jgi:hypothetical protein
MGNCLLTWKEEKEASLVMILALFVNKSKNPPFTS